MLDGTVTVDNMVAPQKFSIELPYDPAIVPLGVYPKEFKAGIQTGICSPMS